MKKIFLFIFSSMTVLSAMAIAPDVVIDDFEAGAKGWSAVDPGWVDFEIVDNPHKDAVNSSDKVLKITRYTGHANWAGVILRNKYNLKFGGLDGQYRYGYVKIFKTTNGNVTFKLEKNGDAGSSSKTVGYTPNGSWQELTFDLGGAAGKEYDDFFVMPDQSEITEDIVIYMDDVIMKPDPNSGDSSSDRVIELPGTYELIWADEFDGASYDKTIWKPQYMGGNESGNHELQYYANTDRNIFIEDGALVLKAIKETTPVNGYDYTSGKLYTSGLKGVKYGRVEARYRLPIYSEDQPNRQTKGTWPAIWMMPQNSVYGGWPRSGEIDIMEYVGYEPNLIYGTVHRGAGSGSNGAGSSKSISGKTGEWHVIRIDWEPGYIKWYHDNSKTPFHTYENGFVNSDQWPFDQAFYVILNNAVGGDWGGAQGVDESIWPQEFKIDYVRVYQKVEKEDSDDDDDDPVSIEESSKENLQIVAMENDLIVKTADMSQWDIVVYSLSGQPIIMENVVGEASINISSLPKGIYVVVANNGKEIYSQKIIK